MVKEKIAGDKLSPEKRGWFTEVLKRGQLLEKRAGWRADCQAESDDVAS